MRATRWRRLLLALPWFCVRARTTPGLSLAALLYLRYRATLPSRLLLKHQRLGAPLLENMPFRGDITSTAACGLACIVCGRVV